MNQTLTLEGPARILFTVGTYIAEGISLYGGRGIEIASCNTCKCIRIQEGCETEEKLM